MAQAAAANYAPTYAWYDNATPLLLNNGLAIVLTISFPIFSANETVETTGQIGW
jgi:hypothetical protein